MNTTIDIATLLKPDLMSRFAVADLLLYIQNTGSESVVVDFADVKFATRSFVDEYYNVIMHNQSSINIETVNIPEDIQVIFDVVQRTQHKEKDIKLDATVVKCKTFADVQRVFGGFAVLDEYACNSCTNYLNLCKNIGDFRQVEIGLES